MGHYSNLYPGLILCHLDRTQAQICRLHTLRIHRVDLRTIFGLWNSLDNPPLDLRLLDL